MNLVTGATGHIGNVLVRELLERGERVRALIRSENIPPALQGLQGLEITRGDLLDLASLEAAMQGVRVVYHLAARITLETGASPVTENVNYQGTLNVLDAASDQRVDRLVYASSIYSLRKPADGKPINENQPFELAESQGVYDASKARASLEVLKASRRNLDAVLLCPTAVVGPYDFHESEAGRAIRLYMRPGFKFIVDGAYDFVDVRDTARGFIQAAEKGQRGETYILGGERVTILQMAQVIWENTGGWHTPVRVPWGLATLAARIMSLIRMFSRKEPLFTRYSLDAISSNSNICHDKATRELGFTCRPARQSIIDSVHWFQGKFPKGSIAEEVSQPAA